MGLDRFAAFVHLAQLGAQTLDVAVDVALVAGLAGDAEGVEQLLAAEYPLGLPEQRLQQAELVTLEPDEARRHHAFLIRQIVAMLCAGLVHGDLSEFNVLLGPDGPVIIDLPQAVDAAGNNHAFSMLERDVGNMAAYFGRFAPELRQTRYAKEMWALYEAGELTAETPLSGTFVEAEEAADVRAVLREIEAAQREEARRQALRQADDAPRGEREEPPPPWLQ